MAGKRVHFVMPADLVERVDAALVVGVSRGEFVRKAVERALGSPEVSSPDTRSRPERAPLPAPAEQPVSEGVMEFDDRGRMSRFEGTYAPREFRPYPKGGKR